MSQLTHFDRMVRGGVAVLLLSGLVGAFTVLSFVLMDAMEFIGLPRAVGPILAVGILPLFYAIGYVLEGRTGSP